MPRADTSNYIPNPGVSKKKKKEKINNKYMTKWCSFKQKLSLVNTRLLLVAESNYILVLFKIVDNSFIKS